MSTLLSQKIPSQMWRTAAHFTAACPNVQDWLSAIERPLRPKSQVGIPAAFALPGTRPSLLLHSPFDQHETDCMSLFDNDGRWAASWLLQLSTFHQPLAFPSTLQVSPCVLVHTCVCECVWSTERGIWLPDRRDTQTVTASSTSMSIRRTGLCVSLSLIYFLPMSAIVLSAPHFCSFRPPPCSLICHFP